MNLKVDLSWKVLVGNPDDGVDYSQANNLFNVRTGKSFLNKIGGISTLDFLPYTLEPTNVFYNALESSMRENKLVGKKFPFEFKSDSIGNKSTRINVKIHRYSSKITLLSVSLDPFEYNGSIDGLATLQRLESHVQVYNLIRTICGLIISGGKSTQPIQYSPKSFPYIALEKTNETDSISNESAVELLTRHKKPKQEIVKSVIGKNQDHQLDENSILVDRQGIFARYASVSGNYLVSQRKFESSNRMFELAIVIAKILDDGDYSALNEDEKASIANLINNPNVIFTKSVTAYKTWLLLIEEFKLKTLYDFSVESYLLQNNNETESSSNSGWSDGRKWFMGILSAIILMLVGWGINEFKTSSQENIKLLAPKDGNNLDNNGATKFSWEEIRDSDKYILFIEKYETTKQKWIEPPGGGRYVANKNKMSLILNENGRFKWRVIARDSDEGKVGESKWYYFELLKKKTPNKSFENDGAKKRAASQL